MRYRTSADRILDHIDRQRNRDLNLEHYARQATERELDSEIPDGDATPTERLRRIFNLTNRGYMAVAKSMDIKRLASRFRAIGDISSCHARGDVSVSIQYLDSERYDDIGIVPFEILPTDLIEMRKQTRSTRPDANALRLLRTHLRNGVMAAYGKLEPRIREAVRARADLGHIAVQIMIDVRPAD